LFNAAKAARAQLDLRHVGFGSLTVCFTELISMHPECSEAGKAAALYRITPTVFKTAITKNRDPERLRKDLEFLLEALEEAWANSTYRQSLLERALSAEQGNQDTSGFWDEIDDYARNFSPAEFDATKVFLDGLADRGLVKVLKNDPNFSFNKGAGYVIAKAEEEKGKRIKLQIMPRSVHAKEVGKPEPPRKSEVLKCSYCNGRGHLAKDCWWNMSK
jgi:hypothetical protein